MLTSILLYLFFSLLHIFWDIVTQNALAYVPSLGFPEVGLVSGWRPRKYILPVKLICTLTCFEGAHLAPAPHWRARTGRHGGISAIILDLSLEIIIILHITGKFFWLKTSRTE